MVNEVILHLVDLEVGRGSLDQVTFRTYWLRRRGFLVTLVGGVAVGLSGLDIRARLIALAARMLEAASGDRRYRYVQSSLR